ncbi:hypothetical protein [Bradyrhizobium sp. SYSU BS000235]|uniref:hypothetical protein n=1 Tax=Bradyrhizobium sp. SYSU BS000235 TaxID=3411332 RepID=UPI003C78111F
MPENEHNHLHQADEDRRKFLAACGKFAVVTPPAITLLLSTSLNSTAVATSGGNYGKGNGKEKNGNNGFGNGGDDGGNKQDITR